MIFSEMAGPRITWVLGSLRIYLEEIRAFHVVAASKPQRGKASTGIPRLDPSDKCLLSIFDIFFWMCATSTKIGDVEAGCNIFTHLAFMSYNMSVCHLVVMFTCGGTRTNQEVYSDAFG